MKTNAASSAALPGKHQKKKLDSYVIKSRLKKTAVSLARALLLFGLCFMIIQPLLTRFGVSLMSENDLFDTTIVILPRNPTLDNYRIVFDLTDFPNSMLNTAWTALIVSVLQVISCTLVAYGFARYSFPLKKLWFGCVIALIVIPPQTFSSSLYIMFTNFDIFGIFKALTGNTLNIRGSFVPYTMMSMTCMGLKNGLYIYMLRQYFRGIPKSLEEAAYVDGCNTFHTFVKIMLPDAMPTILSCFLFSYVWQWTDLFYSRNFLAGYSIYSKQMAGMLSKMSRYFAANANQPVQVPVARQQQLISIAVLVCCIPLIILYVFTQRTFVQSIAMSGSKE